MRRLMTRARTRLGNESGVTIVLIAVILVGLLGMTAFVIDFGRIWKERRELQTGAEAAALAIGEDCARDLAICNDFFSTAEQYADANASDGASAVQYVDLDLGSQTVYVGTATESESGGDSLPMFFAGIIGFDEARIGAEAGVAWGTPRLAKTLPLIVSDCEWFDGTPNGDPDALPEPQQLPGGYALSTFYFHDLSGGTDLCPSPTSGFDLPGGFGWIESTDCLAEVEEGQTVNGVTGLPGRCRSELPDLIGTPVKIPFYSAVHGTGANITYTIGGYGLFVLNGYRFPGRVGGVPPCGPPDTCVSGWFVQDVFHDDGGSGEFGGDDRGVTVIKLIR
jgi:Putative Flp pilus-assembly TadE/G-like